jgi:A/G-specific adenine glycosylase
MAAGCSPLLAAGLPDIPAALAADIRKSLLRWYSRNHRALPWRETTDPYRIWVSEVMLQQTQVATVLPYYEAFLKVFPDLRSLAAAPLEAVLKKWEGLGYYARARNLHRAAGLVAAERNGEFPDTYDQFRTLPGAGDYIASAVTSIAFGRPCAVLDGNVKRVLSRLFMMEEPVNKSSGAPVFKAAAQALLHPRRPGDFNQAMMELGALLCRPGRPDCTACPLSGSCRAFAAGRVLDFPRRERRKPVPHYFTAVGVVRKDRRVLITRRPPSGFLGGLWEFPGGKLRSGETAAEACRREIKEEVGLTVEVGNRLTRVEHAYSHFKISLDVFDCRYRAGRVTLHGPEAFRWILLEEIEDYAFPGANRKFIPLLLSRKGK